jgi:hypothetical protein
MFRQGRLPKLTLICIKASFARRSSSPRCGPRPDLADQPTATKPRPKWKRPARRPARHAVLKSATTKINYKKWETATSWDCHSASADPFRRGPPRSSVTAAKPIPTDRFDAERLAARVDRSSGADFSWCCRADGHAGCVVHSSLALIAASWIRAAANAATMALLTAASWAGCIRVGAGGQMNPMPRSARLSISLSSWMVRWCSPAMTPRARSIRSCTRFRSDQWHLRPGRCLPIGRATWPC